MILIPMAGQSRRFREAGYGRPKYELPIGGESLFACCLRSFARYFGSERFVFVHLDGIDAERFIARECARLGIADYLGVALARPSGGQAESVLLGLRGAGYSGAESLLIFNIDTIRPGYRFPPEADHADGYLEVFHGEGEHWSFVRPAAAFSMRVAATTEKQRISDLCCTGLYHFSRAADFAAACERALGDADGYRSRWGELYIAPLYNDLIAAGRRVLYHVTPRDEVHFAGTPAEYDALLANGRRLY
jgi:hypothetical protein